MRRASWRPHGTSTRSPTSISASSIARQQSENNRSRNSTSRSRKPEGQGASRPAGSLGTDRSGAARGYPASRSPAPAGEPPQISRADRTFLPGRTGTTTTTDHHSQERERVRGRSQVPVLACGAENSHGTLSRLPQGFNTAPLSGQLNLLPAESDPHCTPWRKPVGIRSFTPSRSQKRRPHVACAALIVRSPSLALTKGAN